MLTPRNSRSLRDLFTGFDVSARQMLIDRPRAYFEQIRYKLQHLPETNFELGCAFASRGQWMDARFRFRFAIYLRPNYVQAWYNLGCCLLQLQRVNDARDAFRKVLQLKTDHAEARFMLSGIETNLPASALPKTMPRDMVLGFFTQIAPQYDALAEQNQYQGGRIFLDAMKPYLAKHESLHVVDGGCGTGLVARPWRGMASEVVGMDMTPAMLNLARAARAGDNPVYDKVLEMDLSAIKPDAMPAGAAHVLMVADTAQFVGDLAPLMRFAAHVLAPGGVFGISVEPHNAPHGYGVNPATSRFGHTVEYVKKEAASVGLTLKRDGRVPLYAQLPMHLFVFTKAGGAS